MRDDDRLRVQVLGPIKALEADGRDVTPQGVLQRRLLAFLVLRRGRVVAADAAIEALWPTRPPRDPIAALHNHLFRLRRGLPAGVIESVAEGYRLEPSRIDLDADRFSAALSAGATADPDLWAEVDAILERWQGLAYPELGDSDDGRTESQRLHELWIRARELRAERHLTSNHTDGIVAELSALAESEPLREQPRALLMTALARLGRHADALRVYDDFRRLLGDELGIEPSPALAAQHADLLAGTAATVAPVRRLPLPPTSLIGRTTLVAQVTALAGAHRVVTLVGPGGVGKTRVLIEVGHRIARSGARQPVVLCELATATQDSVVDVVAAALGIDARPGVPLTDRVADVLGDGDITLLLDNCEHVLDPAAALVERLIARCPEVRVVATSRERLRVPGEQVCTVPTLSSADDDAPAVQLFLDRAKAVVSGFAPDPAALACIREIVARLDGLPLAIELAAARLHTHDVTEVAAGLEDRFALLSSGYRSSARHGSLSAAVSWSFGLLDQPLQQTFADLSMFTGSFSDADAAAVCDGSVPAAGAALVQLVERSLVMRTPDRRYVLLETLRAFGAEQLAASGRGELVGARHARHQVDWVTDADRRLFTGEGPVLAEIDAALPELRAGLAWLLDHDEVELAGRLVIGLLDYGFLRLRPDVLAWSQRVAAADPHDCSPVAPQVWVVAAYAAWMAGDVPEAGRRSRRALDLAEQRGGDIPSEVAGFCGNVELFDGRLQEAARWYRRAIDAAARAGDAQQRLFVASTEVLPLAYSGDPAADELAQGVLDDVAGLTTPYAAYAWYCAGEADLSVDVERARSRFARAIELAEGCNASFITGLAGASKASIDARLGDPAAAAEDYRRLITHWRRAGMWSTQWTMLRSVAGVLARLGRHRDAAVLEGAVRAPTAGHRIFGADEVALRELGVQLAAALGPEAYEAARREGAVLDGTGAVEHALRAL